MNVVAIKTENNKIFESQSYTTDEEKGQIEQAINSDAQKSDVTINIQYLSDDELNELIAQ